MRRFLICFGLPALLLTGCAKDEYLIPYVPADLRTPCPGPRLGEARTEGEFSNAVVQQSQALRCANTKIQSIDQILVEAGG